MKASSLCLTCFLSLSINAQTFSLKQLISLNTCSWSTFEYSVTKEGYNLMDNTVGDYKVSKGYGYGFKKNEVKICDRAVSRTIMFARQYITTWLTVFVHEWKAITSTLLLEGFDLVSVTPNPETSTYKKGDVSVDVSKVGQYYSIVVSQSIKK